MMFMEFEKETKNQENKSPNVLYLLPISSARLSSVNDILSGIERPERYLFYGLDYTQSRGVVTADNITGYAGVKRRYIYINMIYRKIVSCIGGYAGDLDWLLPVWGQLKRAGLVFVFSGRIMFALLFMRMVGLLPYLPTVFITVGLPEKLAMIHKKSVLYRYLAEYRKVDKIVCLSEIEADCLRNDYGLKQAYFVPAGVDSEYFHPIDCDVEVDVLSIGGDPFRDFTTLFRAAGRLQDVSFRVITVQALADQFGNVPDNVEIITEVPMVFIRDYIAKCRFLALPVIENFYSGATTVLLQAMAMGKAVIGNSVGPNQSGYNFQSGDNCIFIKPQNVDELVDVIEKLHRDVSYMESIGRNARETVRDKLDINVFHEKIFSLINEVYQQKWGCPLETRI